MDSHVFQDGDSGNKISQYESNDILVSLLILDLLLKSSREVKDLFPLSLVNKVRIDSRQTPYISPGQTAHHSTAPNCLRDVANGCSRDLKKIP